MRRIVLLPSAVLVACGAEEDAAVGPTEGRWTLSVEAAEDEACETWPTSLDRGSAAEFELVLSSPTVFELTPLFSEGRGWGCLAEEAGDPGEDEAEEGDEAGPVAFSCGTWKQPLDWADQDPPPDPEPDATVSFEHDLAGSFTSADTAELTLGFLGACDGTDCAEAGELLDVALPCSQVHAGRLVRGGEPGAD